MLFRYFLIQNLLDIWIIWFRFFKLPFQHTKLCEVLIRIVATILFLTHGVILSLIFKWSLVSVFTSSKSNWALVGSCKLYWLCAISAKIVYFKMKFKSILWCWIRCTNDLVASSCHNSQITSLMRSGGTVSLGWDVTLLLHHQHQRGRANNLSWWFWLYSPAC